MNSNTKCSLNKGRLALFGGEISASTLGTFVDLLPDKPDRSVAVITHAAEDPKEEGRFLEKDFRYLGVKQVYVLSPGDSPRSLMDADGIYACGGDQGRLLRLAKEDGYLPVLRQLHEAGVPYGGSSAGANCIAETMIADGGNNGILRMGVLEFDQGLGLLQQVLVDTHLTRSGRLARDINILASLESIDMVIGLEEDTGLLLEGCQARVTGSRQVWVLRRGPEFSTSREGKQDRERFNVTGTLTDVYTSGDSFFLPSI